MITHLEYRDARAAGEVLNAAPTANHRRSEWTNLFGGMWHDVNVNVKQNPVQQR